MPTVGAQHGPAVAIELARWIDRGQRWKRQHVAARPIRGGTKKVPDRVHEYPLSGADQPRVRHGGGRRDERREQDSDQRPLELLRNRISNRDGNRRGDHHVGILARTPAVDEALVYRGRKPATEHAPRRQCVSAFEQGTAVVGVKELFLVGGDRGELDAVPRHERCEHRIGGDAHRVPGAREAARERDARLSIAAAAESYASPEPHGVLRLLVVGGSQGARVMSDIVPSAVEKLDAALWSRLVLTQQVREEDMARVRAVYDRLKINAELAPFFSDLPARLASSHLVVSRSGAGTVAELAAIGRPSILVPLPGAIDQDQFANAGVLSQADGALRIAQAEFTADRLAAEISAFAAEPARLTAMAANARKVGRLDAAERLADLVAKVAGI